MINSLEENRMIRVLIFGASEGGRKVTRMLKEDNIEILAYVDNDKEKIGQKINGKEVISPEKINEFNYNYILIASMYFNEIIDQLTNMGISKSRIIKIHGLNSDFSESIMKNMYNIHHLKREEYKNIFKEEEIHNVIESYFVCDMNRYNKERNYYFYDYPDYIIQGIDYIRLSTVELISREIKEKNIRGAVAELGVYKGNFSAFISKLFIDRDLYLFDTFEGFHQDDVDIEWKQGFSKSKSRHLEDTNINLVISKLSHQCNYYIIKGYFPNSTVELENINFAFVSIDVDLYKPTYEGLKFFYDRLSKGGYILVHDYNFPTYNGIKEAVRRFCREKDISYIPISDYFGSVVITK